MDPGLRRECGPEGDSMRAFPAGVRDIDDDAVGPGPFLLEIDMNPIAHGGVAALLRGKPLAVRALQLGASLVEIVHLEAEMVDAAEIGAVRAHVGRSLVLVV